jgi:hypothetical protein
MIPFPIKEVGDFFSHEVPADRVVGTYIYPYCLLSEPIWDEPLTATEVIQRIGVREREILITRNGGLFIEPPAELTRDADPEADPRFNLQAKMAFEEEAAKLFNIVICEYALHEIVSEPATQVHISAGKLIDGHALVIGAAGGREIYLERTVNPSLQLIQGTWRTHRVHDHQITTQVAKLSCASRLAEISENLPALTAGAYSLFSRRQLSEALIDAWIVVEQIIDWLWDEHKNRIPDAERRGRLADSRTYTSAVRIELLHTTGVLDPELYSHMTKARTHRNNLAHRARISYGMASETLMAMKTTLEFLCGTAVGAPSTSAGINW